MKKVLITGGTRGIGLAMAKRFASAGYDTAILYRASTAAADGLRRSFGVTAIPCDLGDRASLTDAIAALRKNYPSGFDILINNAAISEIAPLADLTDASWDRIVAVNLTAPLVLSREFMHDMIARGDGRIINVSSVWGQTGASCEVAYSATKAGLIGLTKSLAKELAPSHVTVNAICPGVIDTDMNAALDESTRAALCEEIPAGRFGTAEEVAETAFWLASDQSSYITGQVIAPNGGFYI